MKAIVADIGCRLILACTFFFGDNGYGLKPHTIYGDRQWPSIDTVRDPLL